MGESASKIPWTELALDANETAALFNLSKDRFLRTVAASPSFPERINRKPAAWKAGEVIEWRDHHRASRPGYAKRA